MTSGALKAKFDFEQSDIDNIATVSALIGLFGWGFGAVSDKIGPQASIIVGILIFWYLANISFCLSVCLPSCLPACMSCSM